VATLKKYEVDVPNAPIKAYVIFHYAWVTAEMALLLGMRFSLLPLLVLPSIHLGIDSIW